MSRSFNKIKEAMLEAAAPSKPLYIEMKTYCQKNGLSLKETFFNSAHVPQAVIDIWRKDVDFLAWVKERQSQSDGRRWFYRGQTEKELMENAVAVMGEHFIAAPRGDGLFLYAITDQATKVVKPVSMIDPETMVMRTIKNTLLAEGCVLDRKKATRLMELFLVYGMLNQLPALCAQPDDDRWCLHKITVRPDPTMPIPATNEFLDRLNDPGAFAAYCYAIYAGRYRGRQVLWVQGDGEDGKSTFMKAFATLFGVTAGSADWSIMKNAPQFVASLFVDRKFVSIPDNANAYLLMTEIFKSLANPGADPVTVNVKYGKMYTTELEAHVCVMSNFAPEIIGERHNVSRTLWLTIDEFTGDPDPNYGERLRAELPGFLAFGERCYAERCKDDYEIKVNEAVRKAVAERISDSNERFEIIFEKHFVLDPTGSMERAEFRDILKDEERFNNQEIGNFKRWLWFAHNVKAVQGTDNSRRYRGIRRLKQSDMRAKIKIGGGTDKELAGHV